MFEVRFCSEILLVACNLGLLNSDNKNIKVIPVYHTCSKHEIYTYDAKIAILYCLEQMLFT